MTPPNNMTSPKNMTPHKKMSRPNNMTPTNNLILPYNITPLINRLRLNFFDRKSVTTGGKNLLNSVFGE